MLFYSQSRHCVSFVRSRDWFYPQNFDGTWTFERILAEIASRTEKSAGIIEHSVRKFLEDLMQKGMIVLELC